MRIDRDILNMEEFHRKVATRNTIAITILSDRDSSHAGFRDLDGVVCSTRTLSTSTSMSKSCAEGGFGHDPY